MKKMNVFRPTMLVRKVWFTFVIISVYMIGRKLPLPQVAGGTSLFNTEAMASLDMLSRLTGGNIGTLSLFAIGLSPYMSASIVWQFLSLSKSLRLNRLPHKVAEQRKMLLTISLAAIQALGLAQTIRIEPLFSEPFGHSLAVLVFIALAVTGSLVLIWLSQMNNLYGLGSSSIVIMINLTEQLLTTSAKLIREDLGLILTIGLAFFMILGIVLVMSRAEYRIPLNTITIHNSMAEKSYLPIKLNPASSMPLMYAMSLLVIPQFLLELLRNVSWFEFETLSHWQKQLTLETPVGVAVYAVLIAFLSIAFSFLNVNPEELSESLQRRGDYIDGIRPGEETQYYLTKQLWRLAVIGTIYLVLVAVSPVIVGLVNTGIKDYVMFPTTLVMLVSMLLTLSDQIAVLRIGRRYKAIL